MDGPNLLHSTPKEGLLGKGFRKVSPCMTPLACKGIGVIGNKGFILSLVFDLTISKVI